MKSKLFVIEGSDGSGKETQTRKLCKRLKEDKVETFLQAFPNYNSKTSALVKMYLSGELCDEPNDIDAYQTSTFYSVDRLGTYLADLKQPMEEGQVIVLDRWTTSNAYHQACKIQDEVKRNQFVDWLYAFEYDALKLPRPDGVFFLDVPYEVGKKLRENRPHKTGDVKDIHEQDEKYLRSVYKTGISLAKKSGWHIISCVDMDGKMRSADDIHEDIYEIVKKQING